MSQPNRLARIAATGMALASWAAIALTLAPDMCRAQSQFKGITLGLHTATWHSANRSDIDQPYESRTPGVYMRTPGGLTVGHLSNSLGNRSTYVAWTLPLASSQTHHRTGRITSAQASIDLTAGVITGYPTAPVMPLLTPSLSLRIGSIAMRLIALPKGHPKGAAAVNLAFEINLP